MTGPQYEWVPWPEFAAVDLGATPNFYPGEPNGALHWYTDSLVQGLETYRRKADETAKIVKQCLENLNGAEVVLSTAEGMVSGTVWATIYETIKALANSVGSTFNDWRH